MSRVLSAKKLNVSYQLFYFFDTLCKKIRAGRLETIGGAVWSTVVPAMRQVLEAMSVRSADWS